MRAKRVRVFPVLLLLSGSGVLRSRKWRGSRTGAGGRGDTGPSRRLRFWVLPRGGPQRVVDAGPAGRARPYGGDEPLRRAVGFSEHVDQRRQRLDRLAFVGAPEKPIRLLVADDSGRPRLPDHMVGDQFDEQFRPFGALFIRA